MDWFERDFDHPAYFSIYADKAEEAPEEGPALARLLDLPAGSLVLDLPCGWGRLHPYLLAHGWAVAGGDLSALNLRRHAAEQPAPLARLDLRALPFRDACADGVLCAFTSWGYFATREENLRQLREFARILKPGGALLLDLAGRNHLLRLSRDIEGEWRLFREQGYTERVTWTPDRARILTERKWRREAFRHDIWIPTDAEARRALAEAGFGEVEAWGGLDGRPWDPDAERWIYRASRTISTLG